MRTICLTLASIFASSLAAETIENVEFQFPPSIHEWVLLTDTSTFDEEEEVSCYARIYTHKAGNALEFFTTAYSPHETFDDENDGDNDDFDQALQNIYTAPGLAQTFMNDLIMPYFPNHRISLTQATDTDEEAFLEWEIDDGFQSIVHGLSRVLKREGNEVLLSYMTTASKDEQNTALWKETLGQANWME
jgi:hypothetical protein